jgi:hypothetical protein
VARRDRAARRRAGDRRRMRHWPGRWPPPVFFPSIFLPLALAGSWLVEVVVGRI